MKNDAIVGAIGDTLQETSFYVPGPRPSQLRHYVLQYHEIATGRFRNIPIGCGTLIVLSTFPVVVEADGQPVVGDEDVPFIPNNAGLQGWSPSFDPAFIVPTFARPGLSFTLRRKIKTLSILTSGDTTDYLAGMVPGACHIWAGPDDVEAMDFGLPISHLFELTPVFAAALTHAEVLSVGLHLLGVSPLSGIAWAPSRSELVGMFVLPTWSGAAGLITRVDIQEQATPGNVFTFAAYLPQVAIFDYDFGVPVEIPSYQTGPFNADQRGPLRILVTANANMTALDIGLRFKSWM